MEWIFIEQKRLCGNKTEEYTSIQVYVNSVKKRERNIYFICNITYILDKITVNCIIVYNCFLYIFKTPSNINN